MHGVRAVFACVLLLLVTGVARADPVYRALDWSDLNGWAGDDHAAALSVFRDTCGDMKGGHWTTVCLNARGGADPRTFFEREFRPVLIEDGTPGLFTGYYEPELPGSRVRTDRFRFALYRRPPEVPARGTWLTRAEIETSGVLEGRGLELVWLDDPVDKFFLQVQGSGRIRLTDGQSMRVGFGGRNGHPYRSVGRELVRQGYFESHQVSAGAIRRFVRQNPSVGRQMLHHNPSYIFFREVSHVPPEKGPLGAMNRPVTAGRSLAVDPAYVPLGAPVWVEKRGSGPINRLMVAQDTGSAIKGAQRGDIFFGSGAEAGRLAGRIRDPGRIVVLFPADLARALVATGGG